MTIAVSGKGGVGKTTLAALIVRALVEDGVKPVLAVDADPNYCLGDFLGVEVEKTIAEIRQESTGSDGAPPAGIPRSRVIEDKLQRAVSEESGFDLLTMGRPEGPGCYCAVNSILREVIDSRADSYAFTVIDCEAGLEHLSRRTTRDVDVLIAVADPTKNGLVTARRVKDLTRELMVDFGTTLVVANRVTPENRPQVEVLAREEGVEIAYFLPHDPLVAEYDMMGRPVAGLPEESPIVQAVAALAEGVMTAAVQT